METNDEVIDESFRWGRVIIIGFVVGGWNLLNHYFFKIKKRLKTYFIFLITLADFQ